MDIQQLKARIESIRMLVAESKVSEAIQAFIDLAKASKKPELRDELISISAQQRKLESDTRKYIADASEIELRQNRLLNQLLDLLSDVERGAWVEGEEPEIRRPSPPKKEQEERKKALPLPWIIAMAVVVVVAVFLILKSTGTKGGDKGSNICIELKQEARKQTRLGDYAAARELLAKALEVCEDKESVEDLLGLLEQRMREEQPKEEERPSNPDEKEPPKREEQPAPSPTGFQVASAILKASPADFSGDCPKRIEFDGAITVKGGGGVVAYRFIRSDGAQGPVESLRFDGPGAQKVRTTWTLGGPGKAYEQYWQAIQVLEPNPLESNKAFFNLRCVAPEPEPQGPQVTAVRLQAGPANYTGTCPQEIVFLGRITSNGPGTVSYRFVRSDGAQGPVQQLRFNGPGTEPVRTTWTLGASGKEYNQYWQVLKILEPNQMESNKAFFTLKCK